ncbi:MAG: dipeptidase [Chitinophagaceae bacterium]
MHKLSGFLLFILFLLPSSIFSQNYQKLHKSAILIDTHNDFPSSAIEKKVAFDQNLLGKTHSDLKRMKDGGVDIQVFSIFCGPEQSRPYAFANQEIDSVYEWARRNPDRMMMVYNSRDLSKAVSEKKFGAMMGVEGGHMIEDKLENLEALYKRGIRYMTLTWNNSTSWASSAWDEELHKDSLPHTGLTEFGKRVVKKMNELGMIVDLSHTGEKTFWDAINTTTKPVIASHSCVYNLCPHRRNLKDDQIKAIAKNGGVIHLNFYAGFIDSSYEKKALGFRSKYKTEIDSLIKLNYQPDYAAMIISEKYPTELSSMLPPLSMLMDHLDYIVKLVGVDHVGLGSDFDGIEAPPKGLKGVEDFPQITRELMSRGYSKKDIKKILGGNFIRVLKANEIH